MAEELAKSSFSPTADDLFTALDRAAPIVVWSPPPGSLPLDGLRFLLKYWDDARDQATMPPVSAIDALALKPVLGNIIILDVLEGGADFRFRLFGTAVAEAARLDWTGRTVDDMGGP
ncbi:PAS domain-containing protein [Dongia deserti]|uniref:PAS domain-containing protein n=1 Tax=Dongia deserti TaxID=2268030 RepID=UPI0013C41CEB|nr:PAS domain-containing protein [Dongia deserti]